MTYNAQADAAVSALKKAQAIAGTIPGLANVTDPYVNKTISGIQTGQADANAIQNAIPTGLSTWDALSNASSGRGGAPILPTDYVSKLAISNPSPPASSDSASLKLETDKAILDKVEANAAKAADDLREKAKTAQDAASTDISGIADSIENGSSGFFGNLENAWKDTKTKLSTWTPIQRLIGSAPGALSQAWTTNFTPIPGKPDIMRNIVYKSIGDIGKVGADVLWDATVGDVYQGIKTSVTGQAPKSIDILPGASALASINPGYAQDYSDFDKTGFGSKFNDAYIVGMNIAQAGVAAGALAGVPAPWVAKGAVMTPFGEAPLTTWPTVVKSAGALIGGVGAWITGRRILHATIDSGKGAMAGAAAANTYNDWTGKMYDEQVRENKLADDARNASAAPSSGGFTPADWTNAINQSANAWSAIETGAVTKSITDAIKTITDATGSGSSSSKSGGSSDKSSSSGGGSSGSSSPPSTQQPSPVGDTYNIYGSGAPGPGGAAVASAVTNVASKTTNKKKHHKHKIHSVHAPKLSHPNLSRAERAKVASAKGSMTQNTEGSNKIDNSKDGGVIQQ